MQSGLLEQYVLGLTTKEESEQVEHYAEVFPEIQAEIDTLRNAVRQYAEEQISDIKFQKEQEAVSNPLRNKNMTAPTWSGKHWLVAASLLLFGLMGIYYHGQANKAKMELAQVKASFSSFKQNCEEEQHLLAQTQEQLAFIQHHLTDLMQLQGTLLAPQSKVRVFWNKQVPDAYLQVVSLPKPPKEKQYQAWADIEGKMVDLGIIDIQNGILQPIRCMPKAKSINITLEPLGGSEEPHVDQLFANVSF